MGKIWINISRLKKDASKKSEPALWTGLGFLLMLPLVETEPAVAVPAVQKHRVNVELETGGANHLLLHSHLHASHSFLPT